MGVEHVESIREVVERLEIGVKIRVSFKVRESGHWEQLFKNLDSH